MKYFLILLITILLVSVFACNNDKVGQDVVKLSVDFTWEGMKHCDWGNPEIKVTGIPPETKFIEISMNDKSYRYDSSVKAPYDGNEIIALNKFKEIKTPCPGMLPGIYEIIIKAINENDVVIGIGSNERTFPENQ
jgi:hypothetical protein